MTINERIKRIRTDLKLSQNSFADCIGLKHGAISKMEKDGATVTDQNKRIICDKFHVSMQWLETGDGKMYQEQSRTDELVLWAEKLSQSARDSFPKRFATALSRLGTDEWAVLEKIVDSMALETASDPFPKIHEFLLKIGIYSIRDNTNGLEDGDFLWTSIFPMPVDTPIDERSPAKVFHFDYVYNDIIAMMKATGEQQQRLIDDFKLQFSDQYSMRNGNPYISNSVTMNVPRSVSDRKFSNQTVECQTSTDLKRTIVNGELNAEEKGKIS